ncbi:unnamed protein product [Microthlaspi erraticum]|uniref:Uncharacterized protein n=1 Tax=Microthlaspi erraticum TaxID=1685480 RepID=A0A6D2L465_9BRAS|nr:unnamed protein product [Microthlaspi erraticum]
MKKTDDYVRDIGVQLGYDQMKIVSPNGLSGGLVVFWKNCVSVSCISSDSRIVDLQVDYKAFQFYLSCVYSHPIPSQTHYLWEKLQRLAATHNGLWMMCGDFNEIISNLEKRGGRIRAESSFRNFKRMREVCDMQDNKSKENPFSWVGNTRDGIVECCLDRVMANSEWISETEFLDIGESDHIPMIMSIEYVERIKKGQFRYDKRLVQEEDFVNTVKDFWTNRTAQIQDLMVKLKNCRTEMAKWKRRHWFNAAEDIQLIRGLLDRAVRDPNVSVWELRKLRSDLNRAYRNEEIFWHMKSRTKWLKAGGLNTAYFHGVTKSRKPRTCIKKIVDEEGIIHTKDEAIGRVAEDYFRNMFTGSITLPVDDITPTMDQRVTQEMNAALTRPISDTEIKEVVFSIGPDKAPGIDGFTASFYRHFWEEIGSDVCLLVKRFFETCIMEPGINHTHLCLLPKITDADKIADYRPISLCTVSYKIISKILVMRLKGILGDIISDSQATFVPGRNITDNVLVAHELMHALKSKRDSSEQYLAIKTDISKAYDRVE